MCPSPRRRQAVGPVELEAKLARGTSSGAGAPARPGLPRAGAPSHLWQSWSGKVTRLPPSGSGGNITEERTGPQGQTGFLLPSPQLKTKNRIPSPFFFSNPTTGQNLPQQSRPEGTGTFAYSLHAVISKSQPSRHFCLSLFQLFHLSSFLGAHFRDLFFLLSEIPASSLSSSTLTLPCPSPLLVSTCCF